MSAHFHRILRLRNPVMEYAWGSKSFIPELLGLSSPANSPAAELWMGDHPRAPSRAEIAGRLVPLDRLIRKNPEEILGPRAAKRFGARLPFLLKILAVEQPLSIQAHPDREQARRGYREENLAKIPIGCPTRNYRDPEHKPELLTALTPFEALCGFRETDQIASALSDLNLSLFLPEVARFLKSSDENHLRELFRALLTVSTSEKEVLLGRIGELADGNIEAPSIPDEIRNLIVRLRGLYPDDLGVLGPLFLNFLRLDPEEAIYLAPGVLHAYLRGAGVEIMAGSDNVLRGGLTVKHIDGGELANILSCRCGPVAVRRGKREGEVEFIYRSPAEEYQLSRLNPTGENPFRSGIRNGPEIVLCYQGQVQAKGKFGPTLDLIRGDSVFIPFEVGKYSLEGNAILYRAALPKSEN